MKIRRKNPNNKGTAILECVFVLIILLTLTLGLIGMSILFWQVQHITNAARYGARVGCRAEATSTTVTTEVTPLLWSNFSITENSVEVPIREPVTVTVRGTELDFLGFSNNSLLGLPVPDDFEATIKMAKEGPE